MPFDILFPRAPSGGGGGVPPFEVVEGYGSVQDGGAGVLVASSVTSGVVSFTTDSTWSDDPRYVRNNRPRFEVPIRAVFKDFDPEVHRLLLELEITDKIAAGGADHDLGFHFGVSDGATLASRHGLMAWGYRFSSSPGFSGGLIADITAYSNGAFGNNPDSVRVTLDFSDAVGDQSAWGANMMGAVVEAGVERRLPATVTVPYSSNGPFAAADIDDWLFEVGLGKYNTTAMGVEETVEMRLHAALIERAAWPTN